MGNCVARSPRVQQNRNSNSNNNGGKELISSAATVPPENDASLSPPAIRSRELLQMAEPSDGSFALFYPELEVTKQKLPNNGTIDPNEAPKVPVVVLGQAPASSTIRECTTDGSLVAPKSMRKPSNSESVLPEDNDASFSIARSNSDVLQIAEISDGSFALFYPELELTKQELPNIMNGAIDPTTTTTTTETASSAPDVMPEESTTRIVRSNSDVLQMAEPSDGSFALLYPELEFTKQELPNNGTIDPITVISSAAATVEEAVGQAPPPTRSDFNDGNIAPPRTLKPSTANNPIGTAASSSSSRPARIYAREA